MRLPGRIPTFDDDLQSVQPLVPARLLADTARNAGGRRRGDEEHRDRQHLRQSPAFRFRRERGASCQAIGRSRGGPTTKLHALTDIIGRPYALMLTAGNISDIKAAPTVLERAGRMRHLLRVKGYDTDGCAARYVRPALPRLPRPSQSQARHPLRQTTLPQSASPRKRLLPPQGVGLRPPSAPPNPYPQRQARRELPISRRPRHSRRLLALNEPELNVDLKHAVQVVLSPLPTQLLGRF